MAQRISRVFGLIILAGMSSLMDAQQELTWSPGGPIYTAGRARNMIIDKMDPTGQSMYVGSASSGVFKSLDGGANWFPINDQGTVRNISYLAQAADGTIYVGTGEGFLRLGQKAKAQVGTGLYKLNGATLMQVQSSANVGTVINKVACSPVSSNHIALATNLGILVSTDGGSSFSPASGIPTSTLSSGQDVKFDGNGILYCSYGSEAGTSTVTATKVYKSTDANFSSFTAITPTAMVAGDPNTYGRIELAIAPSNNNVIYASIANKNTSSAVSPQPGSATARAVFVSYDAGNTWAVILQASPQIDPLSNGGSIASGDYAHAIVVNPVDPNNVFVGGYQFYTFIRTGGTDAAPIGNWIKLGHHLLVNTQFYLHENIHDIKLAGTASSPKIYVVTDAGIYRSIDQGNSFQPFYKGLVTGQYNSVSIDRYPAATTSTIGTPANLLYTPFSGFVGGTGGNGMTYYSGSYSLVTQETSYIGGEVYNTEYSKILPTAAYASTGAGVLLRTGNVKSAAPVLVQTNRYTGPVTKLVPNTENFANSNVTGGTQFRLWENYGQVAKTPDSLFFYNDSSRVMSGFAVDVADLITKSTWTMSAARPNPSALIDSIVIRTGTVAFQMESPPAIPAFNTGQTITLKMKKDYPITGTLTVLSGSNISQVTGPVGAISPSVTLNTATGFDNISVTFLNPPFETKTVTSANVNWAVVYRVFATIFYRYKQGDVITLQDNSISTKVNTYSVTLPHDLYWSFSGGTASSTVLTAPVNTLITAINNPTYALYSPGSTPSNPTETSTSSNSFSVNPVGVKTYTLATYGDYVVEATPLEYTLTAPTDTNLATSFSITPGTETNTTGIFVVSPTIATTYTITQGTGTATAETYSAVGASTYILNPGDIQQAIPSFTVNLPVGSAVTVYTIESVSSSTDVANVSITRSMPTQITAVAGSTLVPFSKTNPVVKTATWMSARMAVILNSPVTGNADAIMVSKNPLALNDPMNFVKVSQSGVPIYTDDANGNATFNTITVAGKPTLLEWAKNGSEIYFATDQNKLYRISHIYELSDMSPSSHNGKFQNDIFRYNVNPPQLNPNTPFRTTLIGEFTKQITSISVSPDDKNLLVTFNPAGTGTTGLVMYNTADSRTSNVSNIGWVNKEGNLPTPAGIYSVNSIYCSLIEFNNPKRVFIGTDNGIFYTPDITTAAWSNVNNNMLPNVQIFDMEQQTMAPHDCFNSGQIYVATNGRGIWTNNNFYTGHITGIEHYDRPTVAEESRLKIFPNPSNGQVNVSFEGMEGETATIHVMDISGRTVKAEYLGKLNSGEVIHSFNIQDLNTGIYIVNVSSDSGMKRSSKLIVTK